MGESSPVRLFLHLSPHCLVTPRCRIFCWCEHTPQVILVFFWVEWSPQFVCHAYSSATRADTGVNEAPLHYYAFLQVCVRPELPCAMLMRIGKVTDFLDLFRGWSWWREVVAAKITPPISYLLAKDQMPMLWTPQVWQPSKLGWKVHFCSICPKKSGDRINAGEAFVPNPRLRMVGASEMTRSQCQKCIIRATHVYVGNVGGWRRSADTAPSTLTLDLRQTWSIC